MKPGKLKLNPEDLRVTSFDAEKALNERRGTVKAHNTLPAQTAVLATCSGCSWVGIECCTDPYCSDVNC